uniref:O-acyltransferase WSD1 C-terminal domain-containing protein n=1 Tax=Oryza brachyantha TaxID=4533 RepID=J3L4H2_ORYBR
MDADAATALRKRQLTVRTTCGNGNGFRVGDGGGGKAAVTPAEPVSPSARLVEDFYIVVVIGIATPVNDPVARAGIAAQLARYPRFRSIQDPHTLFKRVKHGEFQRKRIVHRGLSLDDVKFVKNAMNCTVNDVLVGITYSALSRYYYRKSGDTDTDKDMRLRSILLVNLRPTTSLHAYVDMINSGREDEVKWGNALGFIILPFFIGMHSDPLDYVRKAKKVVDRKKSSLEVVFTHLSAEVILKLFGLKAAAAIFHRMISHTTISFSNMIGPVEQVEFCGHPVVFIAPSGYGPPEALTVNYQSYVNTMMVNLAVDEAQFPDCHELLDDFSESLRQIKDAALSLGKNHMKA